MFYIKIIFFTSSLFIIFVFNSCSTAQIASSDKLSQINTTHRIAVYPLENYTDTPRAGLRAANITEGLLLSEGFKIDNRVNNKTRTMSLSEKIANAKKNHNRYLLVGGVSEWRYKTGIDGEPAISLQLKLIDSSKDKIIWSSVGSDNSWGNASIGTVAQELITSMLKKR